MTEPTMWRPAIAEMFEYYTAVKRSLIKDPDMPNDAPVLVQMGPTDLVEPDSYERDPDGEGTIVLVVLPDIDLFTPFLIDWLTTREPPAWMVVCTDVYSLGKPGGELTDEQLEWNLAEEFARGNPEVHEALALAAADHHGDFYLAERQYWFDDDHDIWFRDLEELDIRLHSDRHFTTAAIRKVTSMYGWSLEKIMTDFMMRDRQN